MQILTEYIQGFVDRFNVTRRKIITTPQLSEFLCWEFDPSHSDYINNGSFDAVVSGFLMRNVIDLQKALHEQYRVLHTGGRMVILDTTRPKKNLLSPFIWLHMHFIIPTLGGLLTGVKDAYRYLPETTEGFVTAEEMASRMAAVGFKKINFQRYMFGTIAIHSGEK